MDKRQKEDDDYRKSKQGKAALKLAQEWAEKEWKGYDFTKAPTADLMWPELDYEKIGKFEPWLCVNKDDPEDWIDLNAYYDGEDRRRAACLRVFGIPESCADGEDQAMEIIEEIDETTDFFTDIDEKIKSGKVKVKNVGGMQVFTSSGDDEDEEQNKFNAAAEKHGFKSNELFSFIDHVRAVETYWKEYEEEEEEEGETPMEYQGMVDDAMKAQQKMMDAGIEKAKASGEMEPIHDITLEDWAAANAKIVQKVPMKEILNVLRVEQPQWDEANAEWNDRMTRNFEISKVYADAFNNPDIGKFAGTGPKKSVQGEPCPYEEYVKIQVHMEKGVAQGMDPQSILQLHGKSMSDWTTIQGYWTGELMKDVQKYTALEQEIRPKYEKEYAGGGVGDDISF